MIVLELIVYFSYESEYLPNFCFLFFLTSYFIQIRIWMWIWVLLFHDIDPNSCSILAVIRLFILLALSCFFVSLFVVEFPVFIGVIIGGCLDFGLFRLIFGIELRCCVENLVRVITFCLSLCLFLLLKYFIFFFSLLLQCCLLIDCCSFCGQLSQIYLFQYTTQ